MVQMELELDRGLMGFGIAVALGLIVGFERESAAGKPLGVRSFVFITVFGGLCAQLGAESRTWVIAAGLLALGLVLAAYIKDRQLPGMTTLLAALVMFLIGAAAVAGYHVQAIVLGGAVSLLLHWKQPLHRWVDKLGEEDFEIVARFILIALVVLPVLPNETFGPLDVFNPFQAWLLVVLIVAINLGGFLAFRLSSAPVGMWLAGVLGGFVSSTATTVSYAGISKRSPGLSSVAALVILLASTVVYLRIIVELSVVAPALVPSIAGPTAVFGMVMLGICLVVYGNARRNRAHAELPERTNPAQFRMALGFAGVYVVVLFAVAMAKEFIGDRAIFAVAVISGLTDVDALTLSVGQLFDHGKLDADIAWRAIFLATLANLSFKMVVASFMGSAALRVWILCSCGLAIGAGGVLLWVWP